VDLTVRQEVSVGALVIVGGVLLVALLFWLTDRRVAGRGTDVTIQFTNASGITTGQGVQVSGVKKGRVKAVQLVSVGKVLVTITVDADVAPRLDASASVVALDFLGNKIIDYVPGERAEPLPANTVIIGSMKKELADMASNIATRADELIGNATALLSNQLARDVHNTMVATQRAMDVLSKAGSGPLLEQTTRTLGATERIMVRIDSILGSSGGKRVDTLTANLAQLSAHLGSATAALDTLLGTMNRGEGTLGRVAQDSMLYHNLNETLTALSALLKDLKERPGRYLTVKVF
jgi:phospholipid/cholesterol/gamma-HCH transport system substrate-binding protein